MVRYAHAPIALISIDHGLSESSLNNHSYFLSWPSLKFGLRLSNLNEHHVSKNTFLSLPYAIHSYIFYCFDGKCSSWLRLLCYQAMQDRMLFDRRHVSTLYINVPRLLTPISNRQLWFWPWFLWRWYCSTMPRTYSRHEVITSTRQMYE